MKADLILREIPYGKRKVKYSYDVIENNLGIELRNVIPSRVVLRLIQNGNIVEFLEENNESLYTVGRLKKKI